ncbi:PAS domain S-box protein [Variovorax sp. AFSI2.2]|uniref:sensor histidine kinase n=1 Tax=Variovorax sp. AFSI2.2 TaxID=3384160 RepID=UPI003EB96225
METPVLNPTASHPLWQHQLGLLLESTGEGIFGVDLDGHCMFINRAGAEMLGHEARDVIGSNMHELTHHSHPDGSHYADTDCPIFNAFRRGLPCRIDTEVFWRRDGSAFAVEYSSHPIMDGAQVRGAVITFVDITERRRQAEALQQAKDELGLRVQERTRELSDALVQLRELSAWLDKVREDERTRIAREVHDELGSLLVALKMDVNWIGKRLGEQQERAPDAAQAMRDQMRGKCGNMSQLIERAVDNVGRIITDLRPSILDHQGLWAALEWQAHEFVQSAELALQWHFDVPAGVELPEPAAIAVFRIFQEMLSNVGRHAKARSLDIRVGVEQRQLNISVRDDGIGAPAEAFEAATSYGVLGMRERARHFGGRIDIHSQVGEGSTFRLQLPLPLPV